MYLQRGKKRKDSIVIARAYDLLCRTVYTTKMGLRYADSCIFYSKNKKHLTYPVNGYLAKARCFMLDNKMLEALDVLTIAKRKARLRNNIDQLILANLFSTDIKFRWGNANDALKDCYSLLHLLDTVDYKKSFLRVSRKTIKDTISDALIYSFLRKNYLNAFVNLAENYIVLKKYDSAYYAIQKAIVDYRATKTNGYDYVLTISGKLNYYKHNYSNAIDSLNKSISLNKLSPEQIHFFDYYYLGASYIAIKDSVLGMFYLKKADSLFNQRKEVYTESRLLYKDLNLYYLQKKEHQKQLEVLNKLLYVDSVMQLRYHGVPQMFNQEIEQVKLTREDLIKRLTQEKTGLNFVATILGILVLILASISAVLFFRQRLFLSRYKNLLGETVGKENRGDTSPLEGVVSKEIVQDLIKKLEKFEQEKLFLTPGLTLSILAKQFKTNSKYLSIAITHFRQKNFVSYVNDLRVTYAFSRIIEEKTFQKFTIKALAGEFGFGSRDSFNRAFYAVYKITPSYFLKKIREEQR